jgi:hypothetical protein
METGRLYSRQCGWEHGTPVKFYNSQIITVFSKEIHNIDGKTGFYIINFMEKNGLIDTFIDAYNILKIYPSWYFYYGENKNITAFEN